VTLVDTSVWIDFFAARQVDHVALLERLIDDENTIAICGIVLTEILQGIDDDLTHRRVRQRLARLILLPISESTFIAAADIYRSLRRQGITIRKTDDCIIAACALEFDCTLLHDDRDFDAIARAFPLVAPN